MCVISQLVPVEIHRVSDCGDAFPSSSSGGASLFQTTDLFGSIHEGRISRWCKPFFLWVVVDTFLLHEYHSSMNVLFSSASPIVYVAFAVLRMSTAASPTNSQYFCCAASADKYLSLWFATVTSIKPEVSPTIAMAQILPLTKPSASSGGCRTHWHSSANSN